MATSAGLRRRLMRGLLVVFLLIGMVIGMLWALQRQLIYFPDANRVPPAGDVIDGARDVEVHTEDGLDLGAWFVPPLAAIQTCRWRCWWHQATAGTGRGGPASRRS